MELKFVRNAKSRGKFRSETSYAPPRYFRFKRQSNRPDKKRTNLSEKESFPVDADANISISLTPFPLSSFPHSNRRIWKVDRWKSRNKTEMFFFHSFRTFVRKFLSLPFFLTSGDVLDKKKLRFPWKFLRANCQLERHFVSHR